MKGLFPEHVQVQLGSDLVADTALETKSAVEDMADYDEITFIVKLGDVDAAAVLTFAVKSNSANSTSSPTPTAISLDSVSAGALTSGNLVCTESGGNLDDKLIVITVDRSKIAQRYVFLSITATVESYEVDSIITLKSKSRKLPVTQPSDVYAVGKGVS